MEEDQESHPQKGHHQQDDNYQNNPFDDDQFKPSNKKLCIKFKVTNTTEEAHNNKKIRKNEHDLDHNVCLLCYKSFGSCKALAGHMRVHALSTKKLVRDDAKQGTTKDSKSSKLSLTLLKGWSVTAKRGRKGISFGEKSGSVGVNLEYDNDEIEMQEAANELMLLATGFNHKCEDFSKVGVDQVELLPVSGIKELKIEEKKPLSHEEGFATVWGSQASNGSIVSINKKKKWIKKMKLTELRTAEEKKKEDLDNGSVKRKLRKSNNIQKIMNNESKSCFVSATEKVAGLVVKEEHQVSVVVDESHENGNENCPKILSFDLNEVPTMDEEGDTFQSELFMASSSSSSSYASSQSSVTHW
ncbi:hypothetical protein HN51_060998 [Arachis hypogaea]